MIILPSAHWFRKFHTCLHLQKTSWVPAAKIQWTTYMEWISLTLLPPLRSRDSVGMFPAQIISWRTSLLTQVCTTSPPVPWLSPPGAESWWCSSVCEWPTCPSPPTCLTRARSNIKLWSSDSHSWWVNTAYNSMCLLSFLLLLYNVIFAVLSNAIWKRQASEIPVADSIQLECWDGFGSNRQEFYGRHTRQPLSYLGTNLFLRPFHYSSSRFCFLGNNT